MEDISCTSDETSIYKGENIQISRALLVPLFAAASLYLSSIEYLLPRPVPFFRFGLANIAILLAIHSFSLRDLCVLVILKVLGLGVLNGTIASYVFVFSLLGSSSGLILMYVISQVKTTHISLIGISVIGAMGSNMVQILCAIFYIFGRNAWIIAPYLFMLGIISGYIVGAIAQYFTLNSKFLPRILQSYITSKPLIKTPKKPTDSFIQKERLEIKPIILLICGIGTSIAYIASTSLIGRFIQVLIFFIAARCSAKRIKVLYFCMLIASVTCFALIIPDGKVLISLGSFRITQGALQNGLFRSLTLCGYVFLSLWCISPRLHIPGKVGTMLTTTLTFFYLLLEHVATHTRKTMNLLKKRKTSFTDYADNMIEQVLYIYERSHDEAPQDTNTYKDKHRSHSISLRYGIISMITTYLTFLLFQ